MRKKYLFGTGGGKRRSQNRFCRTCEKKKRGGRNDGWVVDPRVEIPTEGRWVLKKHDRSERSWRRKDVLQGP